MTKNSLRRGLYLFSPIKLGNVNVPNRCVLAFMGLGVFRGPKEE